MNTANAIEIDKQMMNTSKLRLVAGLGFAAMLVAGPVGIVRVAAAPAVVYTAVIDAGSSGSRIFLYEIVPGPYPLIKEIAKHKGVAGDEGIDDFLNHLGGTTKDLGPDAVGDAVIGPLLDAIAPTLKARGVHDGDVVVDLLATAGMRSTLKPIGSHDPSEVDAYYDGIRRFITKKGFAAGEVRTTDGSAEEGLWTWIDVNNRYRDAFRTEKAPVGVVEVGGSSMQVSYPTTAAPDPSKNIYAVTINGKTFSVFDRTYIGLGQDDARKTMRMENPPADGGVRCFPTGLQPAEDSGDIIGGKLVKIAGPATFDPAQCEASYSALLAKRFADLGDPAVANSTAPFYGIAAVRYAFESIGAAPQLPSATALSKAIAEKCVPDGSVANFKISKKYEQRACSAAAYVNALLYGPSGLFHANPDQFKTTVADQVVVDGKVSGSISWTTGYLLQKYAR
ncbi:acetate and sugar kinases/Hsc70/actin family protein [Kaistia algarum]|uniref:hypothetical protein n=1 Tax=Kaistia algarum TaxID=2083279 RepID=UPI0014032A84|nr:hypothetical protein [Kaistia algarum]MCX5514415.1 hypothetical protein [Kaistia algarum]